jgi:UDP-glucose 4-epimerase
MPKEQENKDCRKENFRVLSSVLNLMEEFEIKNMVLASSSSVYGQGRDLKEDELFKPITNKGQMYAQAEVLVSEWANHNADCSALILRNFGVVGTHPAGLYQHFEELEKQPWP